MTNNSTKLFLALALTSAAIIAGFSSKNTSVAYASFNNDDDNSVSVTVCHKAGESGNYTKNTVSVHSVNDANGLNGHGGHNDDVWAPFTFNHVNYAGQGNYSSFNFSNCTRNATPTATASARPSATPSATATPQATQTAVATATPQKTSTPEVTPDPSDVCLNIDGIQTSLPGNDWFFVTPGSKICRQFQYGGPNTNSSNGSVLGASTQGQVLGASTMASTGSFAETLYQAIMGLGGALTFKGFKKLKTSKKK